MVQAAHKHLAVVVAQLMLWLRLMSTIVWDSIAHPWCETHVVVHQGGHITLEHRRVDYHAALAAWKSSAFACWPSFRLSRGSPRFGVKA
jgi:hypothetical protein